MIKPFSWLNGVAFAATAWVMFVAPAGGQIPVAPEKDILKSRGLVEKAVEDVNPWGGVDKDGKLKGFPRRAPVVNTEGKVIDQAIPSSVALADMTEDGLLDLVAADSRGLFWFYPNQGTAQLPKFTHAEIIPIWFTLPYQDSYFPSTNKICLVDYDDDGRVDIVFGNYLGQVFFVPNTGSRAIPAFVSPPDINKAAVSTDPNDRLWGNFLSPIYHDWNGDGRRDLLVGDGTYAANSIYLLQNTGSNATPRFNLPKTKLVLGMGREHLTPQLVDWNGDQNLDIITGERTGAITVFLGSGAGKDFKFTDGTAVTVGGRNVDALTAPVPGDLNGDGRFDLLIGRTSGRVSVAYNVGTPTQPKFDKWEDVAGTNPYPKYKRPLNWELSYPLTSTYHILRAVGTDEKDSATFEQGLTLPEGSTMCAKFEFVPIPGQFFKEKVKVKPHEDYRLTLSDVLLKPDTKYRFQYMTRGSGFRSVKFFVRGHEAISVGDDPEGSVRYEGSNSVGLGTGWSGGSFSFSYKKDKSKIAESKLASPVKFSIWFEIFGEGAFYFDTVTCEETL
jgi:hypothetical protein